MNDKSGKKSLKDDVQYIIDTYSQMDLCVAGEAIIIELKEALKNERQ